MVALLTLLFCKPDIRDEIIATQTRLGKIGLPATKADLAKLDPSPSEVIADKKFASLANSVRPLATARYQKQPLPMLDWDRLTESIDNLTSRPTSFFAVKTGDLMSFPRYSRGKTLAKELTTQAELDAKSGKKTRCLKLIRTAHALSTHISWNQEFVGVFSGRAAFGMYVGSIKRVAKTQPQWLTNHPELLRPLTNSNFDLLFKREYLSTLKTVGNTFPLEKETLPRGKRELEALLTGLQNWELLYPKIRSAKSWSEAARGYASVITKMKNIEVGTKFDDETNQEKFTLTLDLLSDTAEIDAKLKQMNSELAAVGKR
ncbi:MAG: hypothetical protein CBB60_005425 [Armatimonadetes bacterium Cent15-Ar3]|nr:MAG: hypothetical protein CBB60_005425 [Armatimonadetes bacterium Cent15-Ar3]